MSTETIGYDVMTHIRTLLNRDYNLAVADYIQSRRDKEDDEVDLSLKKEYFMRILNARIDGIISLLKEGDFDELVRFAKAKINMSTFAQELDREIELNVEEEGLQSLISEYSL